MKKVVVLASGSGTLARAIFAAEKSYEVAALICDQPAAQVIGIANEFGIKVEILELIGDRAIWDQALLSLVTSHQPDLIVSAGFMRILAPQFVQTFRVINSHPALLPLSQVHMPFEMLWRLEQPKRAPLFIGSMKE
jgi:phosphoribosylglycinamide formyltransferase-1